MVRFKNRYITIEILPGDKSDKSLILKTNSLHNAIQKKVQQLFGDYGHACIRAGFNAKYCNTHTRIAAVKVRHGPHKFLLKAIPQITDVGGKLVSIKILYVGATMKHCFLFIKKYQQDKLESLWSSLRNEEERRKMQHALMSLTPAMKDFK